MKHRILVADDDRNVAQVVKFLLEEEGHDLVVVASLSEAKEQFRHSGHDPYCPSAIRSCPSFDLVVTDLKLPDGTGLDVLRLVKEASPDVPVVLITAFATVNTAVEAMKLGAFDYVQKPFDNDRLKGLVANALRLRDLKIENSRLRDEVVGRHGLSAIVGASPQMEKVREMVRLAATSDAAVMVLGETGTGKELVARAIHFLGGRAARPFVAVNCGAIPENLVESELFGHKKGSFTGATSDRDGRFVQDDFRHWMRNATSPSSLRGRGWTDADIEKRIKLIQAWQRGYKPRSEKALFGKHLAQHRAILRAADLLRQRADDLVEAVRRDRDR